MTTKVENMPVNDKHSSTKIIMKEKASFLLEFASLSRKVEAKAIEAEESSEASQCNPTLHRDSTLLVVEVSVCPRGQYMELVGKAQYGWT